MRPFRFGSIMTSVESMSAWQDQARLVEASGFSVLLVPDHFALPLAPIPAMLAAASATSALRVGSYVLASDFRHPAVLAKEAATVDVLTGGRLELGIGAGWNRAEYLRAGVTFERGQIRFERMSEAVRIIKASFDGGPVHFDGKHHRVDGIQSPVKPLQSPVPLLLGGGARRMLTFAAQHASIVGLMGAARDGVIDMATLGDQAVRQRIAWVCDAAGDRFSDLELNLFIFQCTLTSDRESAAQQIAREAKVDPALVLESPHYLLGTREQMQEQLQRLRADYGISYFAFFHRDLPDAAPVVAQLAS